MRNASLPFYNPRFYIFFKGNSHIKIKRSAKEESGSSKQAKDDDTNGDDKSLDNNERYIETLAVVDQKMVNYHGEDAATQFALVIMNNVRFTFHFKFNPLKSILHMAS